MMRTISLLGIVALALGRALTPSAAASEIPGTKVCKTFYSALPAGTPSGITALFRDAVTLAHRGFFPPGPFALEYCTLDGKPSDHRLKSATWKEGDVCVFRETDVTPSFDPNGKYVGEKALAKNDAFQNESMFIAEGPCPRQDDARYAFVSNASPGIFRDITSAWKRMASSEKGLAATAQFSKTDKRSPELWKEFRDLMAGRYKYDPVLVALGRSKKRAPQITGLYFGTIGAKALASGPFYVLRFDDPAGVSAGWHLSMDLTPTGWKVVEVSRIFT